jgi:hypothetical protein
MLPRQVRLYAVSQDPKTGLQGARNGVEGDVGDGPVVADGVLSDELISPPASGR